MPTMVVDLAAGQFACGLPGLRCRSFWPRRPRRSGYAPTHGRARHVTAHLRRRDRLSQALVPRETNYLINPAHQAARRIGIGTPEPIELDARLFGVQLPADVTGMATHRPDHDGDADD